MKELEVMAGLEETSPLAGFDPDWRDVLERAGRMRPDVLPPRRSWWRGRRVALTLACLAIVAAATPALGLRGKLQSFFDVARSPHADQAWRLAGPHVDATGPLLDAARLTHVDPRTLRRVSVGGSGFRRVTLIGAIGPDRKPWLAQAGARWVSDFFPLFGAVDEIDRSVWRTRTAQGWDGWRFPMYGSRDARLAVFSYVAFGGAQPSEVNWATVVGFVRSDVERLTVVTADRRTRRLSLTAAGGFAFAASRAADLPIRLSAYDANGRLVGRQRLVLKPLSS